MEGDLRERKAMLSRLTNAELLQRYEAGEENAFTVLIDRNEMPLRREIAAKLCNGNMPVDVRDPDVDEVFGETMFRAFKKLHQHNRSKSLFYWLKAIALNIIRDNRKRKGPTVSLDSVNEETGHSIGETARFLDISTPDGASVHALYGQDDTVPSANIEKREEAEKVRRIIASMPSEMKDILVMIYYEEMTHREIAKALNIAVGTVTNRLVAAKNYFKEKWMKSMGEDVNGNLLNKHHK